MESPLISVVLPIYNGERYIEESIRSIVEQSYKNWELIVYNAASTDSTPEVLDRIWNKYPLLESRGIKIRDSINVNLPKSLNLGFKRSKGDFLTWTSDDNRYLPTAFEKMLKTLEENPLSGIVYGHSYKINTAGNRTGILYSLPIEHLVYGNNVGLCFMFHKKVFETINGYDENTFLVEDYDFWMRATQSFKFIHLNDILYEIRYHEGSLTENNKNKMYYLSEDIFDRDFTEMQKWLPQEWKIRGHLRLIKTGIEQKKWPRVYHHILKALTEAPILTLKESALKFGRGISKNKPAH